MKILYTASIRLPTEKAHGIQIMKMCEAFAKSGVGITLLVPKFTFTRSSDEVFQYYGVKNIFPIKRVWSIRLIRLGKIGFFLETFIFSLNSLFSTDFWLADYIFSRDEMLICITRIFGKKTIWETHTGSYNIFARFALKYSTKVIAISQGLKDFYVSKGLSSEKILVAHDGVDLESFSILYSKSDSRKSLGLPEDKSIVLYVGRLDGWKGSKTFLDSSKLWGGGVLAVVIGGEESQVQSLSMEYPNVRFLGPKPYKDLPMNQKSADVLVIPNSAQDVVSRLYTSPLKLFAHMTSGVSIVASDLPSIREILSSENSILVTPDDPHALADAVKSILEKQINADILARQAMVDVLSYSWDTRAKNIVNSLTS